MQWSCHTSLCACDVWIFAASPAGAVLESNFQPGTASRTGYQCAGVRFSSCTETIKWPMR